MQYWFPIILTFIGVLIHAAALIGYGFPGNSISLHVVMLIADILVVVGLCKKTKWGYFLALLLFVQQSIFQSKWAFEAFRHGWDLWWLQSITAVLCIMALTIIAFRKHLFT